MNLEQWRTFSGMRTRWKMEARECLHIGFRDVKRERFETRWIQSWHIKSIHRQATALWDDEYLGWAEAEDILNQMHGMVGEMMGSTVDWSGSIHRWTIAADISWETGVCNGHQPKTDEPHALLPSEQRRLRACPDIRHHHPFWCWTRWWTESGRQVQVMERTGMQFFAPTAQQTQLAASEVSVADVSNNKVQNAVLLPLKQAKPYSYSLLFRLHNNLADIDGTFLAWQAGTKSTQKVALYLARVCTPKVVSTMFRAIWYGVQIDARESLPLGQSVAVCWRTSVHQIHFWT